MPEELTPQELTLLELEAAWEAFCDANPDSMHKLKALSENEHALLELAFKAGYTSGAAMQLLQFRKMHIPRGNSDE
jgi:hypothetical protein